MLIRIFPQTPFRQNTRVVVCEDTKLAICVDPGEESVKVKDFLIETGLTLQAITLTHGHLDHVGGTLFLKSNFPEADVLIHKDDEFLYYGLPEQPIRMGIDAKQLEELGMKYLNPPPVSRNWIHGECYQVGNLQFRILHCPGHTPGHVVLAEEERRHVFVGDCLFAGSIGRTDLPGGNHLQLINSIKSLILPLGDDFIVHSGHGPDTTIGRERRTNPFLS